MGAAEALGVNLAKSFARRFWPDGHFLLQRQQDHTTSGGGMLVSDDADLIAHARKLATQARDPAPSTPRSATTLF